MPVPLPRCPQVPARGGAGRILSPNDPCGLWTLATPLQFHSLKRGVTSPVIHTPPSRLCQQPQVNPGPPGRQLSHTLWTGLMCKQRPALSSSSTLASSSSDNTEQSPMDPHLIPDTVTLCAVACLVVLIIVSTSSVPGLALWQSTLQSESTRMPPSQSHRHNLFPFVIPIACRKASPLKVKYTLDRKKYVGKPINPD